PHFDQQNNTQAFIDAVEQMSTGSVDTVVMIGTNPAYTAPANLEFKKALEQVGTVLHLADHYDETSKLANWHVNKAHFLEAWGDGYSYTGDRSIVQPIIQPLYDGKSAIEFLNTIVNGTKADGY